MRRADITQTNITHVQDVHHDVLHVHHDAGNQEIAACVVKGSLGSPVKH
jgi:hypothetical protein